MGILTNSKHEHFAQLVASGVSQTEAARTVGYSETAAHVQGSRLIRNVKVLNRIEQLKTRIVEKAETTTGISKAWVISRLKENADRAMQAEPVFDREGKETGEYTWNPNAANRSLELIGKELGMFIDRKEIGLNNLSKMSAEDLVRLLDDINGVMGASSVR